MKKTIFVTVLLSIFARVFISCGSTKEIQSAPDTYTSEEEIAAPVIEESGNAETVTPKTATTKKKKNAIEDFFTFGNKDEYIFYFDFHHIIMDGSSIHIFINDFFAALEGKELAKEKSDANDFSEREAKSLKSKEYQEGKDYYEKMKVNLGAALFGQ